MLSITLSFLSFSNVYTWVRRILNSAKGVGDGTSGTSALTPGILPYKRCTFVNAERKIMRIKEKYKERKKETTTDNNIVFTYEYKK